MILIHRILNVHSELVFYKFLSLLEFVHLGLVFGMQVSYPQASKHSGEVLLMLSRADKGGLYIISQQLYKATTG